jgi:hypothetical protein
MAEQAPKHENYDAYTYEECEHALWGRAGHLDKGGQDWSLSWPDKMKQNGPKVADVAQVLNDVVTNLDANLVYLLGPNGSWKGPAAETYGRIVRGWRNFAHDTWNAVAGNPNEKWSDHLTNIGIRHQQALDEFWAAYEKAWVTEVKEVSVPSINISLEYAYPATTTYSTQRRFDRDAATAGFRQVVKSLAAEYDSYTNKLTKPQGSIKYEPAPPPPDPMKKQEQWKKEADEKAEKEKKEAEEKAAAEKAAAKKEAAEEKAAAKKEAAEEKAAAKKEAAEEKAVAEKKAAEEKAAAEKKATEEKAAAEKKAAADKKASDAQQAKLNKDAKAAAASQPGGLGGAGLDKGLDKALDKATGKSAADIPPFTPPGARPPPGVDIPPPVPPPDGTRVTLDKDGKVVPGSVVLPGQLDGSDAAGGSGRKDVNPLRFVRPSNADIGDLALNTPAKASGATGGSTPFGRPPTGAVGGVGSVGDFGVGQPASSGGLAGKGGLGGPAKPGAVAGSAATGGIRAGGLGLGAGAGYPPMMPPMGGMGGMGMGGQQHGERERQTWLLEDDEIWSDAEEAGPTVIGRVCADEEEEEFTPQI